MSLLAGKGVIAATRLVVRVFTDDRAPVRGLRDTILRVSNRLPPLRRAIAARLTQAPAQA